MTAEQRRKQLDFQAMLRSLEDAAKVDAQHKRATSKHDLVGPTIWFNAAMKPIAGMHCTRCGNWTTW